MGEVYGHGTDTAGNEYWYDTETGFHKIRRGGEPMIINIPLQVDEQKMEEVIQKDYQQKVYAEIADYIKATISKYGGYSGYGNKVERGMDELVSRHIDDFLNEHKDRIIDKAAEILAGRIGRTKKAKELKNGSTNE